MSKTRILTALALVLLLAAAASFAHESHKAKVVVKVGEADDLVALDISGLEVGETKQIFSDSGKEVVVTREEDGYKVDVDGKELHVMSFDDDVLLGEGPHKVFVSEDGEVLKVKDGEQHVWVTAGGESHEDVRKIMVRRLGEGEEEVTVQVIGVGEGEHHAGHAPRLLTVEGESAADRLAGSGLLDGLDEETRQKILDFLKKDEPKVIRVKTVVVGEEEDE